MSQDELAQIAGGMDPLRALGSALGVRDDQSMVQLDIQQVKSTK